MRRVFACMVVAVMLFAACAKETPKEATTAKPQTVKVTAANYKFVAPATVSAGAIAIKMTNAGPEQHQAQLVRLNDGVTTAQVIASAKKDATGADLEKIASWAGGPNAVDAGKKQAAELSVSAGRYAFVCYLPDPKGHAHAGLGMVKELSVTANSNMTGVSVADYAASAKEFAFTGPTELNGTIKFTNNGKQPHEFEAIGVAKGKTPADVQAWFKAAPGTAGPPSWTADGGGAVINPGQSENFNLKLVPGTYFLMCFVTDPKTKAPHFALGMMKRVDVKKPTGL